MGEGKTMDAMKTVKMIDEPAGRVGGYLITWGEARQPDMQGEYFTPETDVGLDWYERRPVLYHHGLDGALKAAVIGVIDTLTPDEIGLWAEAQLDLHKRYVRACGGWWIRARSVGPRAACRTWSRWEKGAGSNAGPLLKAA